MKQLTLNFQNDMEATGGMTTSSSQVASLDLASHTVPQEKLILWDALQRLFGLK